MLSEIVPASFFIMILFGISFGMSYAVFDKEIVSMLAVFNLLMVSAFTFSLLKYTYLPIWFLTMGVMIYIQFVKEN